MTCAALAKYKKDNSIPAFLVEIDISINV